MKLSYKNPKELASKLVDLVDTYREGLISQDKFEETLKGLIERNEGRIYKNGFMPAKLISVIGEERKEIIDEIGKRMIHFDNAQH